MNKKQFRQYKPKEPEKLDNNSGELTQTTELKQTDQVNDSKQEESNFDLKNNKYSPGFVLQKYSSQLTIHEQREILNYDPVYYWGQFCVKYEKYTDQYNNYIVREHDHISYRYEIVNKINAGAFGIVAKALDYKTGHTVAIKIINNNNIYYKQGLLEYFVGKQLSDQDSTYICKTIDCFTFREHLCIVFELMDINLYEMLEINNFGNIQQHFIQKFTIQALKGMALMHQQNICHCDIKPENFLFNEEFTQIKLADFGSCCYHGENIYNYIQSRYYRAPEVILQLPFGKQIDIWSLGCVLVELFTGKPIFIGETSTDVLNQIIKRLGAVPEYMLMRSQLYSDLKLIYSIKEGIEKIIPDTCSFNLQLQQIVILMLQYDPNERPTSQQLLNKVLNEYKWDEKPGETYDISIVKVQKQKVIEKISKDTNIVIDMEQQKVIQFEDED